AEAPLPPRLVSPPSAGRHPVVGLRPSPQSETRPGVAPVVIAPALKRRLKVLLVNPGPEPAPGDRNIPMGLIALAATTRLEHDVRIRDWIYERFTDDAFIEDIRKERYDIVGFTSMTWQITTAYRLASRVKKAFPDLPVIMGGIHPTYLAQEA